MITDKAITLLLIEGAKLLLARTEIELGLARIQESLLLQDHHSTPPSNYWEQRHSIEMKVTRIRKIIEALEEECQNEH